MSDLDQLEKLAREASRDWHSKTPTMPLREYHGVANPAAVLDLIARVKAAEEQSAEDRSEWVEMKIRTSQRFDAYQRKKRELRRMEIERDAYKARLDAVRALADDVVNLHVGKISTHSAGCHTWHIECMAARILAALDGDPTN